MEYQLGLGYLGRPDTTETLTSSVPIITTTLASVITAEAAAIIGWNVQSSAFSTSNPINSNTLTSFSTQTPSSPSANGYKLSSGAKAGIGVGFGVGLFMVITLIAWTIILKRKNKTLSTRIQTSNESQTQPNDVFHLPQSCEHCNSQSHELDHGNMRELDSSQINELNHRSLCELDPAPIPVEMSHATPKTMSVGWSGRKTHIFAKRMYGNIGLWRIRGHSWLWRKMVLWRQQLDEVYASHRATSAMASSHVRWYNRRRRAWLLE